jgi:F-type H+-transporting ATPase subunit gamma
MENIQGIAETMATVAAAKLARTRNKALGLKSYSQRLRRIALDQSAWIKSFGPRLEEISPLMREKEGADQTLLLVIAADQGMCGNYNGRVCRLAHSLVDEELEQAREVLLITKGLKAQEYFEKKTDLPIAVKLNWRSEGVSLEDADELLALILEFYEKEEVGSVQAAYTAFYSPVRREPEAIKILPIQLELETSDLATEREWFYEPEIFPIVEELVPTYLRVQVYDLLLESYASEQAARMMAMEDAADRAEKVLVELHAQYNKVRRELVTIDLLGILSAAQVLKKETAAKMGF